MHGKLLESTYSLKPLAKRALPVPPLNGNSSIKSAIALIMEYNVNVLPVVSDGSKVLVGGICFRDMLESMFGCNTAVNVCQFGFRKMIHSVPFIDLDLDDKENLPCIKNCIDDEMSLVVVSGKRYIGVLPSREVARFAYEEKLLDAQAQNPLTGLPGNIRIINEFNDRVKKAEPFRLSYLDINNFKAFNDSSGFPKGDEVIKFTAGVIIEASRKYQNSFVGHVGGDDFVLFTYEGATSESAMAEQCESIISGFEHGKKTFYDDSEIAKGYTLARERGSQAITRIPLIGLSVAVSNSVGSGVDYATVGTSLAALKTLIKQQEGGKSAYRIDRRNYGTIA